MDSKITMMHTPAKLCVPDENYYRNLMAFLQKEQATKMLNSIIW